MKEKWVEIKSLHVLKQWFLSESIDWSLPNVREGWRVISWISRTYFVSTLMFLCVNAESSPLVLVGMVGQWCLLYGCVHFSHSQVLLSGPSHSFLPQALWPVGVCGALLLQSLLYLCVSGWGNVQDEVNPDHIGSWGNKKPANYWMWMIGWAWGSSLVLRQALFKPSPPLKITQNWLSFSNWRAGLFILPRLSLKSTACTLSATLSHGVSHSITLEGWPQKLWN